MLVSLLHSHRLALCLSPVCWAFLSPTTLANMCTPVISAEGAARPGDTHTVTETFVVPDFEYTVQRFNYLFTVQ